MAGLSILQKAACEACWRAIQERNHDRTGQFLSQDTPHENARLRIAEFVEVLPRAMLPSIIMPEVSQFGALRGGYSERWNAPRSALARFDERQAERRLQYETAVIDTAHPWGSNTDSSGTQSRETSSRGQASKDASANSGASHEDNDTPKAKEPAERYNRADEQYFDQAAIASEVSQWQTSTAQSRPVAQFGVSYEANRHARRPKSP